MKGRIRYMNPRVGLVAVLTPERAFTVFELLTGRGNVGDLVGWTDVRPEGIKSISNLTHDTVMRVLFKHHGVRLGDLRGILNEA